MVTVLGSMLEGGQLGHVREVLLSRPGGWQDSEQSLEVVREHLGRGTEHRDTARGQGMSRGGREVAPGVA